MDLTHAFDYTAADDAALLLRIRQGDELATETLLIRYKGIVARQARQLYLQGGDQEDLIQEGMIGLYQAIQKFDPGRDAEFRHFAGRCVESRLYDAVRTAARQKHQPLNESLSLDRPAADETEESPVRLAETIQTDTPCPEESLLEKEQLLDFRAFIGQHLSEYEAQVLTHFLAGDTYREIARQLGTTPKSVDGALQRVRRKMNEFWDHKQDEA